MHTIKTVKNQDSIGYLTIKIAEDTHDSVTLSYDDHHGNKGFVSGSDYFYALSKIREKFIGEDTVLLCKGSMINVFPGGLQSEQSKNEISYEEINGNFVPVNIFDEIEKSEGKSLNYTYEMQKEERRKSIRKSR
jgi:hypothetical protein